MNTVCHALRAGHVLRLCRLAAWALLLHAAGTAQAADNWAKLRPGLFDQASE